MKSPILFILCSLVVPTIVSGYIQFNEENVEKVLTGVKYGINFTKDFLNQQFECYQCTNSEESKQCEQSNVVKKCEMRPLLSRFASLLKATFLGRPTPVPVCLRAEIQVGEKTVTRHSCAMVNTRDTLALDEDTCKASLYMVGGVSGDVEKCELCNTERCNLPVSSTSRARQAWEPYIEASPLVRSMDLGHVQHDVQSMQYASNASPLVASLSLLASFVLLCCIY